MKWHFVWLSFFIMAMAVADDKVQRPKMPDGTPGQQLQALQKQFDEAQKAFSKKYLAAKTDADREKLFTDYPDPEHYAPLFLQIAEQHPKDPVAVDALVWLVRNTRNQRGKTDTPYAKARTILAREHLLSPKIGPFCRGLGREQFDLEAVDLLRRILEKNPDKQVQAQAMYGLAQQLQERADFAQFFQKDIDDKKLAAYVKAFGADNVADLQKSDPEKMKKEAQNLFERLTQDKDYAATVITRGDSKVTLGELAERELFAKRNLLPGKPAPEISGEDIDGKPMKLSDYRGKVVLLDFWGHW
jgi:hypothetical protein